MTSLKGGGLAAKPPKEIPQGEEGGEEGLRWGAPPHLPALPPDVQRALREPPRPSLP